jgi:O-antigen ligase
MARRKKSRPDLPDGVARAAGPGSAAAMDGPGSGWTASATPARLALPVEAGGAGIAAIFALMMFLAPALGVPNEEMLQDTLKSIVVSFAALGAGLLFAWQERDRRDGLRWHGVVALPLLLMLYALGSMAWSHTYLAAVEAIRWFIFSLLLWLGLNTLSRERLPLLALGICAGAVVASLWAALQFWLDWSLFPQGPHPASTFVNRNFFAEFAVCTLPFAAMLIARTRQNAQACLLAAGAGLVIVAILMTGTRGALIALWLQLLLVLPLIGWRYRKQFAFPGWGRGTKTLVGAVLVGTVLGLGVIPTGDPNIAGEGRGLTALERGFKRTGSISAADPSLGVRKVMWWATVRVIEARPLSGLGAGAWESEIPLYQDEGSQLETDYYVHNEFLQLLAEYGLVGWIFLLALGAYLLAATRRTWSANTLEAQADAPWRAVLLCSLLCLLIVSAIGFPWRMASTGALFALCLAALAASDARLGWTASWAATRIPWRPAWSQACMAVLIAGAGLALFITGQAAEAERKIVRATRIALTITASGNPNNPRWAGAKAEMLRLVREGIAINPHYRKITPIIADELAKWGDWENATWIWESVLTSRPHIVAIMSNVARGYTSMGKPAEALAYLEKARKIQPRASAVRSLEVILLARTGQEAQALVLAREALADNIYDYDLANASFMLAWRAGDYDLARRAMRIRMNGWPASRAEGYLQLGNMYDTGVKDPGQALAAFKQALALSTGAQHQAILSRIPPAYLAKLGVDPAAPAAPPVPQTSASKG